MAKQTRHGEPKPPEQRAWGQLPQHHQQGVTDPAHHLGTPFATIVPIRGGRATSRTRQGAPCRVIPHSKLHAECVPREEDREEALSRGPTSLRELSPRGQCLGHLCGTGGERSGCRVPQLGQSEAQPVDFLPLYPFPGCVSCFQSESQSAG